MKDLTTEPLPADTLEAIKSGDLYALLSVCSDDDLAPLVEVVVGRVTNFLDQDDDYKKHSPAHSKYHRQIGNEIRLFGGNSFRNIFRGNEGPPYDEIVVDVCKKLDIPYEKGNLLKNENNLLTIYLERQWKNLTAEEQQEVMAEARRTASGTLTATKAIAKTTVLFALTRLHPIGWGAFVFDLAEPAFRVTVPCVLHIAYLRKRILDSHAPTDVKIEDAFDPTLPVLVRELKFERSDSLEISDAQNVPCLSMTQITDPGLVQWNSVSEEDSCISRLSPLLSVVPGMAAAIEVANTHYMEVVVNGSLQKGKDGAFSAVVRASNGTISEHAKLFDPSTLSSIVNAGAVFQIVSVAVAQKHLADISRKLDDIKSGVTKIQRFQEEHRRSAITGAIRYMEQVAQSVLEGEWTESIRVQIESHEARLLEVQEHILADIRSDSDRISELKDKEGFGSKGLETIIRDHQKLMYDLYNTLLLCIRARACGWQLLTVFPGEERLKQFRKRDIQDAILMLDAGGDLLKQTDGKMQRTIGGLSSVWNTKLTLNERKLSLLEWNDELLKQIELCRLQVESDLNAAEAFMMERRQPTTMLLKIEGDRITGMSPV
ncbi:MAG TPA: hypothetical protein DCL95_03920 [Rhodospirillaceae bacterium]|nr:hypothetical protein [Rhodospirillaceae bacterium]MAX65068.1 hypothetical protein [Rhodospirillaceae bacterium]MBB56175.1 hypothetical protein [Rhodospirillaceae bacterium]HAE00656.1 hypothetical protein [Rhodospirillaceae bacterium]HAJ19199.1 hypothetical protein [Rhodospirillaceae bacterium]|tara:strand:+ start:32891 stop:34693 length:1803 start_codon:yes stop_codon:yes gene_type:complete